MTGPDVRDIVQAIPWALALAGLFGTHFFSEARERRKEFRAQLDKLVQRLADLDKKAVAFHSAAAFDAKEARHLDVEIGAVERIVARISSPVSSDIRAATVAHRKAITLENATLDAFVQQSVSSALLQGISEATVDYEEALEAEYTLRYPAAFPYFRAAWMRRGASFEVFQLFMVLLVGVLVGVTFTYLGTR